MGKHQRRIAVVIVSFLPVIAGLPGSLTDSKSHIPPDYYSFTPPPKGGSYVDPVFGETVVRGTDALGMGREFLSAEYASSDLANADETLVRIVDNGGAQNLFTLPDFRHLRRLTIGSSSQSDFWWDVNDPYLLYAVPENRLVVYNVATDRVATRMTFAGYRNIDGMGESNLSHDGTRLALKGQVVGGGEDLLIYDFSSNSIVASIDVAQLKPFFDASIAAAGRRVVVHGGGVNRVWDISGNTLVFRNKFPSGSGHSDQAMGPDGRPYMFGVDSLNTNTIYRYDILNGTRTALHTFGWTAGVGFGIYISTNSLHNDGWVYVSSELGTGQDPDPSQAWVPYVAEVFRMRWDTGAIERLAHTRTLPLQYYASTRASVARGGKYVFWSSNYRKNHVPNAKDNYADVYFMDLSQLTAQFPDKSPAGGGPSRALGLSR